MVADLAGPAEIAQPAFAARSGFLGSLLYWLTVHHFQSLSPLEGKALLVSVFILHGVLVDLFRYCMPLLVIVLTIPEPLSDETSELPLKLVLIMAIHQAGH